MRSMRLFVLLIMACSITVLSGCASIVSDTRYPVAVESNTSGELTVEDRQGTRHYKGETPANVTLSASQGFFRPARYEATLVTDDGSTVTESFRATLDPWYIGNVVFGGAIGLLIVDPATGAMWKLRPNVHINAPTETNARLKAGPNIFPTRRPQASGGA